MGDGAGLSWPVKKNELRGKRKPIDVTFVMWARPARPLIERGARRSHMVDETLPASGDAGQACVARGRQVAAPLLDDGLSDVRDPHGGGAGLRFDIGETTAAISRQHATSVMVIGAQGRWAVYVQLRIGGKIVVPEPGAQ
jgi:hypothetical protein